MNYFRFVIAALCTLSTCLAAELGKDEMNGSAFSTAADATRPAVRPSWVGMRPPVPGNWVQTFDENFDGSTLNLKLWTPNTKEKTYGKLYVWDPTDVSVTSGVLKLKAEKKTFETWDYTSGQVDGFGKWAQAYGYFEAKVKLPVLRGLFPAVWMMPDRDVNGPTDQQSIWNRNTTKRGGMEFDIMEHVVGWGPGRYNVAAHWDGYQAEHKSKGNDHIYFGTTSDGWHVFGMLWEPGKLTFYCDGLKKAEWSDPRVGSVPAHFILSNQLGGWGIPEAEKRPDGTKMPATFDIDYVRAWQLKERIK